jgi:hypothetical protein
MRLQSALSVERKDIHRFTSASFFSDTRIVWDDWLLGCPRNTVGTEFCQNFYFRTSELPSELVLNSVEFHVRNSGFLCDSLEWYMLVRSDFYLPLFTFYNNDTSLLMSMPMSSSSSMSMSSSSFMSMF